MLIYNTTIKVALPIHQQWLLWMKNEYIGKVMESRCFTKYVLVRLLNIDEEEGPTYALQLYANSINEYERYEEKYRQESDKMSYEKWGSNVIFFRTLLEIIN